MMALSMDPGSRSSTPTAVSSGNSTTVRAGSKGGQWSRLQPQDLEERGEGGAGSKGREAAQRKETTGTGC